MVKDSRSRSCAVFLRLVATDSAIEACRDNLFIPDNKLYCQRQHVIACTINRISQYEITAKKIWLNLCLTHLLLRIKCVIYRPAGTSTGRLRCRLPLLAAFCYTPVICLVRSRALPTRKCPLSNWIARSRCRAEDRCYSSSPLISHLRLVAYSVVS